MDVVERGCVVARRCRSIFHWVGLSAVWSEEQREWAAASRRGWKCLRAVHKKIRVFVAFYQLVFVWTESGSWVEIDGSIPVSCGRLRQQGGGQLRSSSRNQRGAAGRDKLTAVSTDQTGSRNRDFQKKSIHRIKNENAKGKCNHLWGAFSLLIFVLEGVRIKSFYDQYLKNTGFYDGFFKDLSQHGLKRFLINLYSAAIVF